MKEKNKLFIKPLTPISIDENIISSDDIYFESFNLITQNLDKKMIKRIVKDFYIKASKYSVNTNLENDIKKRYEHLKKVFNIKTRLPKNLNSAKNTYDSFREKLKNNDILSENKHYNKAYEIAKELNHFFKISNVEIDIENEMQELNKESYAESSNKNSEKDNFKSYDFLIKQFEDEIINTKLIKENLINEIREAWNELDQEKETINQLKQDINTSEKYRGYIQKRRKFLTEILCIKKFIN